MKKLDIIGVLALAFSVFLFLTLFTGCSTIYISGCNNYIGLEKEECIKKVEQRQRDILRTKDRFRYRR